MDIKGGLKFVSTTILESSDNLTFDKETYIKKPEAPEERKHPDLAKLDNRTLYEQLQANKEAAEEEAAARRALAFAPQRGLEEDEVTFLEEVAERANLREKMAAEQEEQDKAAFSSAIANRTFVREEKHLDTELAALRPPVQSKSKGTSVKSVLKTRIKVKKRGAGAGAGSSKAPQAAAAAKRKREPATVDSDKPTKQARTGAAPVAKPNTQPKAQPAGLGLLASYDSSDEDSDTGSDSD